MYSTLSTYHDVADANESFLLPNKHQADIVFEYKIWIQTMMQIPWHMSWPLRGGQPSIRREKGEEKERNLEEKKISLLLDCQEPVAYII